MNTYTGKLKVLAAAAAVGMGMLSCHRAMATMETFQVVNGNAANDIGYKVNSNITFNLTAGQVQITFNNTSLMHAAGELLKGVSF
ncbi:MAG TPA: hypothetical protein VKJ65_01330 [Phycisphaerae bacterium]|nr:hypothetical protein [Phycisphaerae bacterium]